MKISAAVLDRMQMPSPYAQSRPVSVDTVELGAAANGAGTMVGDHRRLSLDEINTGFDRLAAGAAVRQVIVF
ncbi:hypothetical protein [Accumulibacter sp.]|uniref:hypothetical protein n=1 Tax=Accumulibacter sp. TaxID=2053492 RepID=UPI0028C411FE|nr:hypothetical protein [Accumulibacter sp.]